MSVTVRYLVNGRHDTLASVAATVDGQEVRVNMPVVEVELVDPTNRHGSIKLQARTPEERDYFSQKYQPGSMVGVQF